MAQAEHVNTSEWINKMYAKDKYSQYWSDPLLQLLLKYLKVNAIVELTRSYITTPPTWCDVHGFWRYQHSHCMICSNQTIATYRFEAPLKRIDLDPYTIFTPTTYLDTMVLREWLKLSGHWQKNGKDEIVIYGQIPQILILQLNTKDLTLNLFDMALNVYPLAR